MKHAIYFTLKSLVKLFKFLFSTFSQAMKFGHLIENNMRKIYPEKLYTKCGGETISRPFSKKSKLSIFLDQFSKVLYSLF